MRNKFLAFLQVVSQPAVALGGAVVIAVLALGGAWYLTHVSATGAYSLASAAPITEEVDVSGAVQGAETTDLSFQVSGQVASIPAKVGQHVGAGQVLVALSGGAQAASLAGAEANLEAAQANLASLQAGTRTEQLAIDQNAVTQDTLALANALSSAYVAADTAVHVDADQFFTNPRTPSAALTITVPDSILANRLVQERIALESILTAWSAQVNAGPISATDLSAFAATAAVNASKVSAFLDDASAALSKTQASGGVSAANLAAYQASIAGARTSATGVVSAITSAQSALVTAQGTLALAQAGATPQAIAAAQAQVDAAKAQVQAAQVGSSQTVIVAPISGTITVQNAHLGQTVSPGTVLVSMIGSGSFEAKAPVSESDIGKIKVGQAVSATFDAYPGASFPATITAVDPAATMTNGVSSYQVTATFTGNDPRIQSGLSAHLSILTATASDALVVPASAVISNNGAEFVYVKSGKSNIKTSVTTGIESADGKVQILSGLSAGESVLTFGNSN